MIHIEQHGPITCIRMARAFLGKPIYWTAAYWLEGLLIDSGPRCATPQLQKILQQLGVQQVVITHSHEDHIGGLAMIRQTFPHAPIYASTRTIDYIEEPTLLALQLYRRLIWGVPETIRNVIPLEQMEGPIQTPHHQLRVVETPGHTLDHVSYFEPEQRWLFCGDAFIGGHDRVWPRESDLFAVVSSLRALASLRPERLFPGSGNVRRTAIVEIHDKINYLLHLAHEVARLEAMGMKEEAIVAALFQEEPTITFWTRGHFSAQNLVAACRHYNSLFAHQETDPTPTAKPTLGDEEGDLSWLRDALS